MAITPPTDDELNTWILARLANIGIDITTLPADDSSAPADQRRVLNSIRGFVRGDAATISLYLADVQENPPVEYPAPFSEWTLE